MLIDMQLHKSSLADLWHTVFGDNYDFINLIFNEAYRDDVLCFGEIADGKAVSAFYLLRCCVDFNGNIYNGWYLYSAATLPEFRGRGLMGRLITEAQKYCAQNDDFICLVPANDGLYGYYRKFGFCEAMYCCESVLHTEPFREESAHTVTDSGTVEEIRSSFRGNMLRYSGKASDYVYDALKSCDAEFLRLSENAYCIFYPDDNLVVEFICDGNKLIAEADRIKGIFDSAYIRINSPYDLSGISDESCISRFGMIYPIADDLRRNWKFTDIYMNLALN